MTKYLRQLRLALLDFSLFGGRKLAATEPLSRFIIAKQWVDWKKRAPKAQAFMPRNHGGYGTSVYRSGSVSMQRLTRIGRLIASGTRDRTLYGRTVITPQDVAVKSKNRVWISTSRSPSLHRDIVGWPEKPEQKLIAEYLAIGATFEESPWR